MQKINIELDEGLIVEFSYSFERGQREIRYGDNMQEGIPAHVEEVTVETLLDGSLEDFIYYVDSCHGNFYEEMSTKIFNELTS